MFKLNKSVLAFQFIFSIPAVNHIVASSPIINGKWKGISMLVVKYVSFFLTQWSLGIPRCHKWIGHACNAQMTMKSHSHWRFRPHTVNNFQHKLPFCSTPKSGGQEGSYGIFSFWTLKPAHPWSPVHDGGERIEGTRLVSLCQNICSYSFLPWKCCMEIRALQQTKSSSPYMKIG